MNIITNKWAYYNDVDPKACAWARELIKAGLIAPGEVDERSITEVEAADLKGFIRHHFFSGICGWDYALQLAGWPDDRPVCTASLPCQPFSVAGKKLGKADERHLLPHFLELVRRSGFRTIFGEQVPGAIKHGWLDDLCDEMERENYATRAAVLTAAGAGAPHIRQRLYWVANAKSERRCRWEKMGERGYSEFRRPSEDDVSGLGKPNSDGRKQRSEAAETSRYGHTIDATSWNDCEWLYCRDNKYRPIKPGSIKMASRISRGMVCCCDKSKSINDENKEGEVNANASKTDTREILFSLRDKTREEAHQRKIGGFNGIQETEVLQPRMYGERTGKGCCDEHESQQEESNKEHEIMLRGVWRNNYTTCTSCGRKSFQQLRIEFDDVVFKMPPTSTFSEFLGADGSSYMQILRKTGDEDRALLDSQYPAKEVWESLDDKEKDRVRIHFNNRAWVITDALKPLVDGVSEGVVRSSDSCERIDADNTQEARVMRLKGYGNAICPQVAAYFISRCIV